ncbi:MAG: type I glutamate--ammonia ligase [Planctomycetes bacterium]|nr:type I glutamate--ammonia ligase [Planctomycetota bacterium]
MTPDQVLQMAEDKKVKVVDVRFVDPLGTWHHLTVPINELEGGFEDGFGFDGGSIRSWQLTYPNLLLIPDPSTAKIEPLYEKKTMVLICDVVDPFSREALSQDPRNIAKKAEKYVADTGIGDQVFIGPEPQFFVFDEVRYQVAGNRSRCQVDSVEGQWNTGASPNLGYTLRPNEGAPLPPNDSLQDMRTEMLLIMERLGIDIEQHHHELATGQCSINMRFKSLVQMADQFMWYKHIVRNVALRNGKTATFMPRPMYDQPGSGMHVHLSIWKGDTPLFAGDKYAGLSQEALYGIGGILKHAPTIAALTNPTTNSYKRLLPGSDAPVLLTYSSTSRSTAVYIPMYSQSPKAKRLEVRFPDPSCNLYLGSAALLMAVLDGIKNKIDPGDLDAAAPPVLPHNLEGTIDALEQDNEFLTQGNVFTQDAIDAWIAYKREVDIATVNALPHPKEFELYYDI